MKNMMFAAALLLTAVVAAQPARADRWVAPDNGKLSAMMMPDGDVMMKVTMPPAEFKAMAAAMNAGNGNCKVIQIYPQYADTMILRCN